MGKYAFKPLRHVFQHAGINSLYQRYGTSFKPPSSHYVVFSEKEVVCYPHSITILKILK